jgi:hypothetical protein
MTDHTSSDDQDDVLNTETSTPPPPQAESDDVIDQPVEEDTSNPVADGDKDDVILEAGSDDGIETRSSGRMDAQFDDAAVEMRGGSFDELKELIKAAEKHLGAKAIDAEVRQVGSWANIIFRMRMDPNFEEIRIQRALSLFSSEELALLKEVETNAKGQVVFKNTALRNAEGKIILRTSALGKTLTAGSRERLTGTEALLAFDTSKKGGGYRIPLLNSGLTIDILAPTGNDFQTMLMNCTLADKEMGSNLGAHYFTYNDVMYKTQILNFLEPLIIGSSFVDWREKGQLFSLIKLPDLAHILATIAAISYPDGYPDFAVTCKRLPTEENKEFCGHAEKITADIFKMIVPRYSVLSREAIEHMTTARNTNTKHSATQIAKYQSDLAFEGEVLTFGEYRFIMRIPTLTEHLESGSQFLADIINEVSGDNTQGREEQIGVRYMRTFLPWIASMERHLENGAIAETDDYRVITRVMEQLDLDDQDNKVRQAFEDFIGRAQLTYIGHPILPCPKCGHVAETPSGMWTFDPFSTFFTLAFQYLKPSDSSETAKA